MRKLLISVAAIALLAACQSTPKDGASTSGAGMNGSSSGNSISSRPTDGWSNGDAGAMSELRSIGDRVYFGLDKVDLTPEAQETLKAQALFLNNNGKISVTIEGHADERGTREYNLALGERRASSVKNYLKALGITESRVNVISYGEERPEVTGSNEDAWAANRRAVSVIGQ